MQGIEAPSPLHVAQLPIAQIVPVFFFLVFFVWAVYTIVASYHWLRYSNNTTLALSAITTHIIVSLLLAIYTVSGIH